MATSLSASTLPSASATLRNCLARSLCTSALAENRDGHGLIVKLGQARGGMRHDFAVGIETRQRRVAAQHVAHGFNFLADALAEQQFAADAADQNRDALSLRRIVRLFGRGRSTFDQAIE